MEGILLFQVSSVLLLFFLPKRKNLFTGNFFASIKTKEYFSIEAQNPFFSPLVIFEFCQYDVFSFLKKAHFKKK